MGDIELYLPVIIPFVIINLVLVVVSLRHLIKHPKQVRGPIILWVLVIIFIQVLGSVAFLTFGREQR